MPLPSDLTFDIVVAVDQKNGIGVGSDIPWYLPGDLKYLKKLTQGTERDGVRNAVIMGRKTWETIPLKFRPLRGRHNVVITRNHAYQADEGVLVCHSLEQALTDAAALADIGTLYLLGGGEIYRQAVALENVRRIYLTQVEATFPCTAFFPPIDLARFGVQRTSEQHEHEGLGYVFQVWERRA